MDRRPAGCGADHRRNAETIYHGNSPAADGRPALPGFRRLFAHPPVPDRHVSPQRLLPQLGNPPLGRPMVLGRPRQQPGMAAGLRIWETEQGEIAGAVHADWPAAPCCRFTRPFAISKRRCWPGPNRTSPCPTQRASPNSRWKCMTATSQPGAFGGAGTPSTGGYGYLRWRTLAKPIPCRPPTPGYVLRSLNTDVDDAVRYAAVVNTVFPRFLLDAGGGRPILSFALVLQRPAPGSRGRRWDVRRLRLLTVDSANRTAIFEPVGTHPNHRRKHLAEALMVEGLQRLPLGVDTVYVGTGDMIPANRLLRSARLHRLRHDLQLAQDFR